MAFAFLPEIVAAGVALVATKAGDKLRAPTVDHRPCAQAQTSNVVWSYEESSTPRQAPDRAEQQGGWFPVRRDKTC